MLRGEILDSGNIINNNINFCAYDLRLLSNQNVLVAEAITITWRRWKKGNRGIRQIPRNVERIRTFIPSGWVQYPWTKEKNKSMYLVGNMDSLMQRSSSPVISSNISISTIRW